MVSLASVVSVLLYLIAPAALLAARSRRGRELWEIALDIPLAVSIDLLGVLLLGKVLPLQIAVIASRVAWIAVAAVFVARRRRSEPRVALGSTLGAREIVLVAAVAAAAVLLSAVLSRPYTIWDRFWHTPLVATIRGQNLPFMNVYEPKVRLYYHFAGNVLASMFQVLSLSVVHSSFALSLAHDVMFGLTGVTLALLLRAFGMRRGLLIGLSVLGVLLAGPVTAFRLGEGRPEGGYSYLSYLVMSYRPHVSLAGLLIVGFLGAALVRLRHVGPPLPLEKTGPVLIATTALLGITDEPSIGVLGLALGVAWLFDANVVAPKRAPGIAVLLGLAAALAAPNLLFSAALSPGAHSLGIEVVPWRSPGYHNPPLPLTDPRGRLMLMMDLAPMIAVLFVGLLGLARRRDRAFATSVVLYGALLAVSTVLLTHLEVDHSPYETHRFMTAITLATPIFGLAWITPFVPGEPRPAKPPVLGPALVVGFMVLGAVANIEFIQGVAPKKAHKHDMYDARRELYSIDCRKDAGATLSDKPSPAYIAESIWYLYAGCRPVFAPPTTAGHWTLRIGPPKFGIQALTALHREMLGPTDTLDVFCPADAQEAALDPVCAYALPRSSCHPVGALVTSCKLSAAERAQVLASPPPAAKPSK